MAHPSIDILIPTYNRSSDLKKNLGILSKYINEEVSGDQVRIIVCDNCSPDDTKEVVEKVKHESNFPIQYFRNEENIGLEKNVVKVLSLSTANYVMFVGDDDYIDSGYLGFVISTISNQEIGAIIPGLNSLLEDGKEIEGRKASFDTKTLKPSFESTLYASHLAHQMSGLVLKRENLLSHYLKFEQWRNPYLFIHFLTYCLLRYESVYAPKFKTKITAFNTKDWGYNKVGLLDEVFKSYLPFMDELSSYQIRDLLLRFSVMHSYRYAIKRNRPLQLVKQFLYLIKTVPSLPGFRYRLGKQLIKEYLLALRNAG